MNQDAVRVLHQARLSAALNIDESYSMLLRRVTQHVRDQNWTAIAIDFFIVVVGVFIGIQVANWNSNQQSRQDEAKLLERLQVDFEMVVKTADNHNSVMEPMRAELEDIAVGLQKNMSDEEIRHIGERLQNLWIASPPGNSPTVLQLISSGEMNLIRSDELRDAVAGWDSVFQVRTLSDPIVLDKLYFSSNKLYEVKWLYGVYLRSGNSYHKALMRELIESPSFMLSILQLIDGHSVTISLVNRQRAAAILMLEKIQAARFALDASSSAPQEAHSAPALK